MNILEGMSNVLNSIIFEGLQTEKIAAIENMFKILNKGCYYSAKICLDSF